MAATVLRVLIWSIVIFSIYELLAFAFSPNTIWDVSTPLVNLEQQM